MVRLPHTCITGCDQYVNGMTFHFWVLHQRVRRNTSPPVNNLSGGLVFFIAEGIRSCCIRCSGPTRIGHWIPQFSQRHFPNGTLQPPVPRDFPFTASPSAYYSEGCSSQREHILPMLTTNMPQLAEQLNQLGLVTLRDTNGQVILMVPAAVDIQQVDDLVCDAVFVEPDERVLVGDDWMIYLNKLDRNRQPADEMHVRQQGDHYQYHFGGKAA